MAIYNFICKRINGEALPLSRYRGDVLLIVNTASKCGFTPQYRGLEALYRAYRPKGFAVLGFPCDQFLHQEYSSGEEIERFCLLNYEVSFPLFEKIDVKGDAAHPLFRYLAESSPGLLGSTRIKWTFTKFLIDRTGRCVKRFSPMSYPGTLRRPIERLLAQPPAEGASG